MEKILKYIMPALCFSVLFAHGQVPSSRVQPISDIFESSSKKGWLEFKTDANINQSNLFINYKSAFGLGADDEMKLSKTNTDEVGQKHYRFNQFYKGFKVYGAEMIVHSNSGGKLISANGKIIEGLNKPVTNNFSESALLEVAKKATGAKSFLWEDARAEEELKAKKKSSAATYFPKGDLIWVKPDGSKSDDAINFQLCYKFDIATDSTGQSKTVFVSTETGRIIKELTLELNCFTIYNNTIFNGQKKILTSWDSGNSYYFLQNDCSYNPLIHVMDAGYSQTQNYLTEITSTNNVFTDSNSMVGVQVFWDLHQTQRYYSLEHNRDSYDNSGADIDSHFNVLFNSNGTLYASNAQWNPSLEVFRFGYGPSGSIKADDYVTLDIVSHEFTHAVTQYSAGLEYAGESGALNESFSDIFGEIIENYVTGTNDWLCGAQIGALRSFANPDLFFQPRSYYDTLWAVTNCGTPDGSNDYCGVHTNSGVQNMMFYLLCMGGSGTNYSGNVYNVQGIGINDASAIAYRALTVYLTATSNHYDSREAWIKSANDLFGSCSNQSIQTAKAWYAVAVGHSLSDYNIVNCGFLPPIGSIWDVEYNAINSIVASPSHCNNVIMSSNVAVYYDAYKFVQLLPGFHAQAGSHFNARIDNCAVTNYKVAWHEDSEQVTEAESALRETNNNELSIQATPNPFNDEINVQLTLNSGAEATIQVVDMLGKITNVPSLTDNFEQGINHLKLNTAELGKGIYLLVVKSNNKTQTIKVVK